MESRIEIWDTVTRLQGETLKTLDRGKRFDIIYAGDQEVIVRPHVSGSDRNIGRDVIQDAFAELVRRGELSRADIQERYSDFNPAYVAAILAQHPDVSFTIRPIKLQYRASHS